MGRKGSSTTQQTKVEQKTEVTVQNVIEGRGLEPIERVKMLADIFKSFDEIKQKQEKNVPVVIIKPQTKEPLFNSQILLFSFLGFAGVMMLTRRK